MAEHAPSLDARMAAYEVEARRHDDAVELEVRDFGSWRAPHAGSRGRGLKLISQLVDELEIDRTQTGTVVRMRRAVLTLDPPRGHRWTA